MKQPDKTAKPTLRRERIEDALDDLLGQVLRRGFYGKAEFELQVADGAVVRIVHRVERTERS